MSITKKLAFIGCGKMAQAIIHGLINSQTIEASKIIASDRTEALPSIKKIFPNIQVTDNNEEATSAADIIIFAVKPQMMADVCPQLKESIATKTVISIAAGLKVDAFLNWLDTKAVIRLMPNTPLTVGLGATAYCVTPETPADDKKICEQIFSASGIVEEVEEAQIDAVTALSGSGPAYIFELIDAMAESSEKMGLERETSIALACQTLIGAATMVKNGIDSPINLRKAVTSPNGTTEAALKQMDEDQFRTIVDRFLNKAYLRSIELGK